MSLTIQDMGVLAAVTGGVCTLFGFIITLMMKNLINEAMERYGSRFLTLDVFNTYCKQMSHDIGMLSGRADSLDKELNTARSDFTAKFQPLGNKIIVLQLKAGINPD